MKYATAFVDVRGTCYHNLPNNTKPIQAAPGHRDYGIHRDTNGIMARDGTRRLTTAHKIATRASQGKLIQAESWRYGRLTIALKIAQVSSSSPCHTLSSNVLNHRLRTAWDKGVLGGGCSSVTGRRRWLCAELATRPFHSPVTTRCRAKTLSELAALFSFSKTTHADSMLHRKASPLFLSKFLFAGSRFAAFYAFFLFLQLELEPVSAT